MTIADSRFMMEDGGIRLPCSPEEERRIFEELTRKAEANLAAGNIYYLISYRWFVSWKKYVGLWDDEDFISTLPYHSHNRGFAKASCRPGPIDNSDIVIGTLATEKDEPHLIKDLKDGQNYVLVPEEVWEKLFDWYRGGPAIPRKMIPEGLCKSMFSVEVYPLLLNLIDSRDGKESILQFSKQDSVRKLYDKIVIWDYFKRSERVVLLVSDQSLEEAGLVMGQDILLEVKEDRATTPFFEFGMDSTGNELALAVIEPPRSSLSIAGGPLLSINSSVHEGGFLSSGVTGMGSIYSITNTAPAVEKGGLAGLQNLGNTCFMNSAIQCLVHSPPLAKYFLDDYSDDINTENPLGLQGELALAFGDLLRKLWSSGRSAIAPRAFKSKLGRFAPQFSGYAQHDSQELLAFLLDGLHEDLNRVKRKPYIESKDSDSRPDEEVAEECWINHRARNDSLIVDVCQGQYKSTLVCPVCGKISITFDPFMYLSVPVPSPTTRVMAATVISGDGRGLPMLYTVTVQKLGSVKDLLEALGSVCCLNDDECLLLAEVYDHKIFKYFENPAADLSSIKDEDCLVAYRLQKKQVTNTKLEIHCGKYLGSLRVEKRRFGCPLVTYLDEKCLTGADICSAVSRVLSPFRMKRVTLPLFQSHSEDGMCIDTDVTEKYHDQLIDDVETTDVLTCSLNPNLHYDDENVSEALIDESAVFWPGQSVRVFLDWNDKVHQMYDYNYLGNIPAVNKGEDTLKEAKQESLTLFSCLEAFLKEEPLGPDDMWYCPGCKEHRQATKKLDLWRLPDIIVFHLKRFSYSRYWKNKLDSFVDFPIHKLNLSKYVKSNEVSAQSNVYDLYAISNHYGGLGGGHYTAYAKLMDEDKWFHFDDSHVLPVDESDIKSMAAYVLFYQRVKGDNTIMETDGEKAAEQQQPSDAQTVRT
uniref:Ubiquitin carboxyl-terminal hydrolase n=1 Tax=Kalanchoe fedtschenkoi TaxID=63787 RepID=A0A7N0T7J2_KALFE